MAFAGKPYDATLGTASTASNWQTEDYGQNNNNNKPTSSSYGHYNAGNIPAYEVTESFANQVLDQLVAVVAIGIIFGVGGALGALAFTSISPMSAALMGATYAITFLTTNSLLDTMHVQETIIKIPTSLASAILATNLVVYAAFPYLGLAAVSWQTTTIFSTANFIGDFALSIALLMNSKNS